MSQNNESKPSTVQSVTAEVADALAALVPELRTGLVRVITKREHDRRVDILDKAMAKHQQLFVETKKLKPKKMVTINEDGTTTEVPAPVTPDEAKAFQKQVKEANDKLAQFNDAFTKAVDKGDAEAFDKLEKAVKG